METQTTRSPALALLAVVLTVGGVFGCSKKQDQQSETRDASTEIHPDAVHGGGTGLGAHPGDISLCRLVKERGDVGAGVYTVSKITQDPYDHPNWTSIRYERNRVWGKSPPKVVTVWYPGGPSLTQDGGVAPQGPQFIEAHRGQTVGAVISRARNQKGTYWIGEGSIFHKDETGRYSNGRLFLDKNFSLAEVGTKIKDMYRGLNNGNGCPYDIQPADPEKVLDAGTAGEGDTSTTDAGP